MDENPVIIVGAGPSGLATAACLLHHSIPYIILEREDRYASLWTKYSYDSLRLNLPKSFSSLPHMPFPTSFPTFMSKDHFIEYLDSYISHFNIAPLYRRSVDLASYDEKTKKWKVNARNLTSGEMEEYSSRFLVVASGVLSNPYVPEIEGLDSFTGKFLHSTQYKNGNGYGGRNVLVIGSGESGMDIALDITNHGGKASIVVRSPIHILSRNMGYMAMVMFKYKFPVRFVNSIVLMLSKIFYGNLSKYGIKRPEESPFSGTGYRRYFNTDGGAISKIKSGEIQVFPAVSSIRGNEVEFVNGKSYPFDTIVFCTGFQRSTNKWLKEDSLLDEDGFPKQSFPNYWKGKDGIYSAGLNRKGLIGTHSDARNIADDIKSLLLK